MILGLRQIPVAEKRPIFVNYLAFWQSMGNAVPDRAVFCLSYPFGSSEGEESVPDRVTCSNGKRQVSQTRERFS